MTLVLVTHDIAIARRCIEGVADEGRKQIVVRSGIELSPES